MKKVTLIRHGKTAGNLEKRYIGITDEVLCKEGREEIAAKEYPKADIVLIGEAPGAEEDASGLPFVGRAGKFLTQIMEKAGLDRKKDLFIINTVKCRPPENRVPTDLEKNYCEDYLMSQLAIINPKVIILCGATACETFFDKTFWKKNRISNLRVDFFENQ